MDGLDDSHSLAVTPASTTSFFFIFLCHSFYVLTPCMNSSHGAVLSLEESEIILSTTSSKVQLPLIFGVRKWNIPNLIGV